MGVRVPPPPLRSIELPRGPGWPRGRSCVWVRGGPLTPGADRYALDSRWGWTSGGPAAPPRAGLPHRPLLGIHHSDEARSFLREVFQLPADLIPDPAAGTLVVRLHGMSNWRSNRALSGSPAEASIRPLNRGNPVE
jgi:hypothetical protein